MSQGVDTSRTIIISSSLADVVGLASFAAVIVAGGAMVYFSPTVLAENGYAPAIPLLVVGSYCIGLGLFAVYHILRSLKYYDDVITITPDGIRDRRVSKNFVPWWAVTGIHKVVRRGHGDNIWSAIKFDIDPKFGSERGHPVDFIIEKYGVAAPIATLHALCSAYREDASTSAPGAQRHSEYSGPTASAH